MMPYVKRIVCLANSRRERGRCVAGKEVLDDSYGSWVRPVSDRTSGSLSLEDIQYGNRDEPDNLHIIDVPMIAPDPRDHQSENHLIDANQYWVQTGTATWEDLEQLADRPTAL